MAAVARLQCDETETISDEQSSGYKDDDLSTEAGDDRKDGDETSLPLFSWVQDGASTYDERDELLAAFDAAISPKMKQRLDYIVKELIDTEHDYVRALEYIMENYMAEMDTPNLPPSLAGKKNVLFGNLVKIHDFHKLYFSQKLESCQYSPLLVGKCFLQWERQFYLYALYNKNKPRCDALLNDFGNQFFKVKQDELGDKLNLASYLIKPVQRLGKYALLLKDMINCCARDDPRVDELTSAHDMMKFQLRHGNDLMAMDSIRGCDVNLKEQGCLLRQGDFFVFSGRRKRMRRVFLFEHSILFTKSKKQSGKGDIFVYKYALKNADVGLTENIGSSGLKFELWYRRWRRSRTTDTFVLQASSTSVKESWVSDITRILWRQAQRNKEYGITEMATGISVESHLLGVLDETSPSFVQQQQPIMRHRNSSDIKGNRLSWISGSSSSSGVHDMNSFLEAADSPAAVFDDDALVIHSTVQRTSSAGRRSLSGLSSDAGDVQLPDHRILRRESSFDSEFVRSNIHRRTIHGERATSSVAKDGKQQKLGARGLSLRFHKGETPRPKSVSPTSFSPTLNHPSFDETAEDNAGFDKQEFARSNRDASSPTTRRRHSSSSSTSGDSKSSAKETRAGQKNKESTKRSLASLLRIRRTSNDAPPTDERQ